MGALRWTATASAASALSVGAELLLQAAARTRSLRAVVSEGAGVRSIAEHLHAPGLGRVQRWFSNWAAQTAALAMLGDVSPPDDLKRLVGRVSPQPVLLIEASRGAGGEELTEAAGPDREPLAGARRSHRCAGGPAGRVRAARRRLLRRCAALTTLRA